jgi:ankyrin repeat protein
MNFTLRTSGADVNTIDNQGAVLLLSVLLLNVLLLLRALSFHYAGETPLFAAAQNGHLDMVKLLLKQEGR